MKVLFISHDAFRAGAQLLLLEFMKWCRANTNMSMEVLLVRGGDLVSDFESMAKTHFWANPSWVSRRHQPAEWWKQQKLLRRLKKSKFDLIYSNTATNGEVLSKLAFLNVPEITHIHELAFWLDRAGQKNWEGVLNHSHAYIAAAEAVKTEVVKRGLPAEKIKVIYEHTQLPQPLNHTNNLKTQLKLPAEALIVGACGGEIWRKGKDLFVTLAEKTLQHYRGNRPVHFIWIGGKLDDAISHQWHSSSVKDCIHFVSHLPDAANYFKDLVIFAMLSRDDPFPTVNLEAGIRNVPVLAFAESGGSPELLEKWPAQIIPFENIDDYAARILYLLNNSEERQLLGLEMANHIKSHFLISQIGPQLLQVMRNTIK